MIRGEFLLAPSFGFGDGKLHFGNGGVERVVMGVGNVTLSEFET